MAIPIDPRVVTAISILCLLTACGVEITPQGAFACDADRRCPQGQQCIAGVCLDADALADAIGAPDAIVKVEIVEKVVEKVVEKLICPDGACDDANPCTIDACEDAKCTHTPKEGPCDDGDTCTESDACKAGTCTGGQAKTCDDTNACTLDGCDPKTGCTHIKLPLACNDDDACTGGDLCADGTCKGGPKTGCDDANPCTDDGCDPKTGCTHVDNTAPCDDGDACTGDKTSPDACAAGTCQAGITLPCDCASHADCAKLDDGNPCTGLVVCGAPGLPGKCTVDAATVLRCDPSQDTPCRKNTCTKAAGGCVLVAANEGKPCDDGDACSEADACKGASCAGAKAKTCDDGKPCTLDLCDGDKGCTHAGELLDGKPCDSDGSVCTEADACKGGTCVPGAATSCDDGEVCTTDGCDAKKGCTHVAVKEGTTCDDGDACTSGDGCAAGLCKGGKAKSCDDGKPCTVFACDPKSGTCSKKTASDGAACGEGQGACSKGACIGTDSAGRKWGLVPAGTFYMGCNATLDKSCQSNEKPQHPVEITKPFWLGVYEVTVSEYKACVDAGKCTLPSTTSKLCSGTYAKWHNWPTVNAGRGAHPVNCVDWSQSRAYCKWAEGTLATEARWELAARGRCEENGGGSGCASKMRVYPWGNTSPVCGKHAVLGSDGAGCGEDRTWAAGTGSASGAGPYGHLDLAGNVFEWVSDLYSLGYYASSPKQDPENTNGSSGRVVRGRGFYDVGTDLRASARIDYDPDGFNVILGIRCARPFQPCDDANPCTTDARAKDGSCTHKPAHNGAACDDGDACTAANTCKSGTCAAGKALSCDDGNACTVDFCTKMLGCIHKAANKGAACDDGDACTSGDGCAGTVCKGGKAKSCDDGKPCALFACDPKSGKCSKNSASDGTACGKGQGACSKGACIGTDSAGRKWGLVPAGTFYMGCNAALNTSCGTPEKPQHLVEITKPFWLGLYEVTVGEYDA